MEEDQLLTRTYTGASRTLKALETVYISVARLVPFAPSFAQMLQIARYLVSGVLATLTHLGLTYGLTELAGIYYVASSAIGFLVGFGVSFTLQKFWTFQNRDLSRAHTQFAAHISLQLAMLAVNSAGVFVLTDWIGLYYMLSQVIVVGLIAVSSFFIYKFVIFR